MLILLSKKGKGGDRTATRKEKLVTAAFFRI